MKHAKALGQLVQIRGPARHCNKQDMALLKASRGLIVCQMTRLNHQSVVCYTSNYLQVMHSMFSGEECFLASEGWHRTMRQQYTTEMPSDLHSSIEHFFAYFTFAPSLVHKMYSLKHMDVSTPQALHIISQALEEALDMQCKVDSWYRQWSQVAPLPVEAASRDDPLFPIILTYRDMIDATIYCSYYSYKVIIHEALKTFSYPGPHEALVAYYRDQICRSIEYASTGVLGPYRMGFPLRVAIEVADPATKSWIIARLQQLSKVYAAVRPDFLQGTSS